MIFALALAAAVVAPVSGALPLPGAVPVSLSCSGVSAPAEGAADYYAIELVPTGRVPGTRLSKGVAYQTAAASPFFGVALAPTGEYLQDLDIQIEGLRPPPNGAYVAWVTDTDVAQIVRLGVLDANLQVRGQVRWNKFLVVITREPSNQPTDTWQGPIIMRGMSRSGRMHTLAGHGPFQAEPCLKYGFR
ncbi:MAG: hypothetical protein PVJ49_03690 [Acidobacteriota bacterium]|jgi:hypothetical protein